MIWAQSMLPDPTLWISGSGDALRDWLYCALSRPARLLETTYPESMGHFPTLRLVCSGPQGLVSRSWAFSVLAGLGADLHIPPERSGVISLSIAKRIEVKVAPHAAILGTAALVLLVTTVPKRVRTVERVQRLRGQLQSEALAPSRAQVRCWSPRPAYQPPHA